MAHSRLSYQQTPLPSLSVSYRQASALPGFDRSSIRHCYSPERDDLDRVDSTTNAMPLILNRFRTNNSLGSHKSLSESIQSLRSNQQTGLSLPVRKRSDDHHPPTLPKREQKTSPSNLRFAKNTYQDHHYSNPAHLRTEQQNKGKDTSSEEEFEQQQINRTSEDSLV